MKKWLVATLLVLGSAQAQGLSFNFQIPNILLPAAKPVLKDIIPKGYDTSVLCNLNVTAPAFELAGDGDLTVNWPAQFPNPKRTERFTNNYRLNCPNFVVERVDGKSLTVLGLTPPQLYGILDADYDNHAYLYSIRNVQVEFGEGNSILATTPDDDDPRESVVIATRQPGQGLKVLVFDGAKQDVAFDPAQPVEIFAKSGSTEHWQRMVVDWDKRLIHFDVTYPFPTR